jgi:hypothetical protein
MQKELMIDHADLLARASTDKVLKRKVNAVKKLYKKRSKGLMNEAFFEHLAA